MWRLSVCRVYLVAGGKFEGAEREGDVKGLCVQLSKFWFPVSRNQFGMTGVFLSVPKYD